MGTLPVNHWPREWGPYPAGSSAAAAAPVPAGLEEDNSDEEELDEVADLPPSRPLANIDGGKDVPLSKDSREDMRRPERPRRAFVVGVDDDPGCSGIKYGVSVSACTHSDNAFTSRRPVYVVCIVCTYVFARASSCACRAALLWRACHAMPCS